MKWTIKWESSMDTNDADYVYDSGEYGDVDDTNPKDMKDLAFTQAAVEYCCDNFDEGSLSLDEDELRELMVNDEFLLSIATKEEIEEFCKDIDVWDLAYDYRPNDPNDCSYAHDWGVTWSRIPADVKELDADQKWIGDCVNTKK